jgi:hypothetical protein
MVALVGRERSKLLQGPTVRNVAAPHPRLDGAPFHNHCRSSPRCRAGPARPKQAHEHVSVSRTGQAIANSGKRRRNENQRCL